MHWFAVILGYLGAFFAFLWATVGRLAVGFGWVISALHWFKSVAAGINYIINSSKLLLTVLLVALGASIYMLVKAFFWDITYYFLGYPPEVYFDATIFSRFCDISLLRSFISDALGLFAAYMVVFTTGLSVSIAYKGHALASRSIKI